VLGNLAKFFGEEYSGELQGIADITTDWGIDLGKLVGLNLIYELTEGCTSIVAQADDGSILHGRNLDYSIPGLQDITLVADFQSNNKTQYTGTVYLGYVGLLTGMRKGSFAVTVNQRNEDHELKNLVNLILNGYKSVGMFLRTQLNTDQNYNDAIGVLQRTPLAAPVYLTVSGVKSNEGMVITRGWDGPDDVWPMASPKEYFRCQTNDDHWEPANDKRRAACNDGMGQYTRNNINATLIFEQLSEAPVFNDATIYTTIMCAATGEQYTLVRNL
jgi:N-acylethanolamine-hydrolysing acid amidase